jgi:acyl-CoA synthetase (AMP-forming)/AMP-acid ligase II
MSQVQDYLAAQVATRPQALALTDSTGAVWSYEALNTAAAALADRLLEHGVQPGDRVMIVSENCAAAVAALFAAWQVGAIAVPVNARQSRDEISRILVHATPRVTVLTTQVSADAAIHADRMNAQPIKGPWGSLAMALTETAEPYPDPDIAVLLYTTGTTGDPKGVMLTHGNVCFGGLTSANLRAMTPADVIYGVLPMTHVFGLCSVVVAAVHAGAPVRLVPRFEVGAVYDGLRDGVTLFSAVPQMHALLMAHARTHGLTELGSTTLRYVSSGAAPLDPTWKREAEAFYGLALQNGYGMTETTAGTAATSNAIGDPDTSVGPPLPGIEVAIDIMAPGGGEAEGEVMTRGPHIMRGYFRNPAATDAVLDAQGWMHTGDLGRIDDKGHLHILGRSKELIIHGGFNVYPPEVEAALNDHPQVVLAAVVGRKIAGDEEVLAFVQVAPGCTLDEATLKAFVRDRLAGYKRPARIILATQLPSAVTGKVLKHKLLDSFADALK